MADLTHAHHHAHAAPVRSDWRPGFSLLRLSAGARLLGAGALVALIWLGVFWALAT